MACARHFMAWHPNTGDTFIDAIHSMQAHPAGGTVSWPRSTFTKRVPLAEAVFSQWPFIFLFAKSLIPVIQRKRFIHFLPKFQPSEA